jgi:hypothetical protein
MDCRRLVSLSACHLVGIALAVSAAAGGEGPAADGPIKLADVTRATGIEFVHYDGSYGKRYIVEEVTGGLAIFDYDGDGKPDIYFTNGAPIDGPRPDPLPTHALFHNEGGFRFRDASAEAGVKHTGFGMGVAAADFDNDGYPDLYVSNYGPNILYHNNGDGTFTDVTGKAGVGRGHKVGGGVAFLDIDGDGLLDLYAANYVRFSPQRNVVQTVFGVPMYPGPRWFDPEIHNLFRNRGDGTFEDVTVRSGIAEHAGTGMGMIALDYDRDGNTDIFVCNDCRGNFLWHNDGNGKFSQVAVEAGVAYNTHGDICANMAVDAADWDHRGRLDLFVTDYQREYPVLYRNLGGGAFEDASPQTGVSTAGYNIVKWGCAFGDFDNDGYPDLFIGCGHTQDNIELIDDTTSYAYRSILLRNDGNGRFVDVSGTAGDGLAAKRVARGVGVEDLDGDGRLDVVICTLRSAPVILRNETRNSNHWLEVRLESAKCNRDAVGSQVKLVAGNLVQCDEVHSGRGYQSHFGMRLHFGLGRHQQIDRLEVHWLGGGVDVLENVPVDRVLTIAEGSGKG